MTKINKLTWEDKRVIEHTLENIKWQKVYKCFKIRKLENGLFVIEKIYRN